MWSPVTLSKPTALNAAPLNKLPPPTTNPTCTPMPTSCPISKAIWSSTLGSIPKPSLPISASPLSFNMIRLYFLSLFDISIRPKCNSGVILKGHPMDALDTANLFQLCGNFGGEINLFFLNPFTNLIAYKGNHFSAGLFSQFANSYVRVFDERLLG